MLKYDADLELVRAGSEAETDIFELGPGEAIFFGFFWRFKGRP